MPSLTLTYSAEDAQRILAALGNAIHGGIGGAVTPATAQEAKDWITGILKRTVKEYEHRQAIAALPQPPIIDVT